MQVKRYVIFMLFKDKPCDLFLTAIRKPENCYILFIVNRSKSCCLHSFKTGSGGQDSDLNIKQKQK